jgi:hypothetical protein
MITITGRDIIAKFLTGQTSSFASHIAIGCGAQPGYANLNFDLSRKNLQFEMGRFPITSRSQVVDSFSTPVNYLSVDAADTTKIILQVTENVFYIGQNILLSGAADYVVGGFDPDIIINGYYTVLGYDDFSGGLIINNTPGLPECFLDSAFGVGTISATIKKIAFTAEIPTADRYLITEFGIYPSGTDSSLTGSASRILSDFTQQEVWQYVNGSTLNYTDIQYYSVIANNAGDITQTDKAFQTNANNSLFDQGGRPFRNEKPRFLEDATIVAGNMSEFTAPMTATGDYISVSNFGADLSKNSASDELRLAFSIINKLATPTAVPRSANVMLQFACSNGIDNAKYHFRISDATSLAKDISDEDINRYHVLSLKLGEPKIISATGIIGNGSYSGTFTATISGMSSTEGLVVGSVIKATDGAGSLGSGIVTVTSVSTNSINISSASNFVMGTISNISTPFSSITNGFSWSDVRSVRLYSSVETAQNYSGSATSEFSICLDSLRFENTNNTNPLYGLVGYTVLEYSTPILKDSGTKNLVEFKIALGLTDGI